MKVSKLIVFIAMVLVSFSSFATNVAKGIYENNTAGLKKCWEDAVQGKAVGYEPTTKNQLTSTDFEKKTVGKGGACLTGAYVREDKGSKVYVGTVFVSEGFEYGEQTKGKVTAYRMVKCSNPFQGIYFPTVKLSERQSEPAQATTQPPASQVIVVQEVKVEQQAPTPTVAPTPAVECKDCTPNRKTEVGEGGWCRVDSGRVKLDCNFEWKVLHTQDQVRNCGCQVFISSTNQIVGFMDAMPGSPRCRQQKKFWTEALGLVYNDSRPPQ